MLIRWVAAGLCHSDEHLRHGDIVPRFPIVGGHEGAGVIEKVGPGVSRVEGGRSRRHVVPARLRALPLVRHRPLEHLRLGATILDGCLPDGTFRFHDNGDDVGAMCMLGHASASTRRSPRRRCVSVDKDLPLETVVLVGCGVPTGWCSAVYAADVVPGETVIIYGIGGIGANAVQGAAHAGAANVIAVDPLANKREAAEDLGATHSAASAEEAHELAQELTRGVGADKAIITVDIVNEEVVGAGRQRDPQGRHGGHHRPRRPEQGHRPALGRGHDALREDRQGHAVRLGQPDARHPQPDRPLPGGQAQARRADHQTATRSTTSARASRTCSTARTSGAW